MTDSHRLRAQLTAFENLEHPPFNREKNRNIFGKSVFKVEQINSGRLVGKFSDSKNLFISSDSSTFVLIGKKNETKPPRIMPEISASAPEIFVS